MDKSSHQYDGRGYRPILPSSFASWLNYCQSQKVSFRFEFTLSICWTSAFWPSFWRALSHRQRYLRLLWEKSSIEFQVQPFKAEEIKKIWHADSFQTALALPIPGGMFCVPLGVTSHFYTFWVPMICFESTLCALAIFRALRISRAFRPPSPFRSGQHLLEILFRDSLIYFIAYVSKSLRSDMYVLTNSQNWRYLSHCHALLGRCRCVQVS